MTKKPTLKEAMKDPTGFKEQQEQSLAEANLEQSELTQMESLITAFGDDRERETATVILEPTSIEMQVYVQLTGEDEAALGVMQNEALKAKAWKKRKKPGTEPNFGNLLDSLIRLLSSICAEAELEGMVAGEMLSPEEFFTELHTKIGTERLYDILELMIKPFEAHQERIRKFPATNKRR